MNVLAIGNSFSMDASRYLHQIAKADNCNLTIVNLYIGGCPLSRHYKNMLTGERAYSLEYNGETTGFCVSMSDALLSREWDYITLQQVSSQSGRYDTYQPYLNELSAYIRKYAPKAKQLIHQTWAYEQGSQRLCAELGYMDQADMYNDIKEAYEQAALAIDAEFIIPSGELFQKLIKKNIKIHRDTFHADLGVGRYALGLLWYAKLTGNDISDNAFADFDKEIPEEEIIAVKNSVTELLRK